MSVEEKKMWEYMDFCSGEIRVMAGRYGGGWLAAGCAVIEWDFDEKWEDLVGGDSDYFDASDFFNQNDGTVLIECAASPREAFDLCVAKLAEGIHEET
ncbi:hypothetical protein PS1M3_17470 [Pseudoalteromonas sp. PS1M3]|uniref:hypothetical protein n=1 Tax=Pseudoalteromonas sp. PS1M3 TaxID=87791 RepID=UPI00195247C0|nr:hypothetical protein [Pseudoalteromonas sp. PS1M3]BBW91660.1 hypothetical protein PS1M3_17470 [Pseudoalteromonas sp. PS1M3]